jgi:serine phosphatase RsbU (regulator of sigma subunit)/PAS domain-containing protein
MQRDRGPAPLKSELAALMSRRDALRQAAALPDAELRSTLDAALAELDAAIDTLAGPPGDGDGSEGGGPSATALHAERGLLRALFQDAPVPLFLLERDGTVRRVNRAAGALLETGTGYATGKLFTAFVNLPSRAAVQTQLAAVIRTGSPRQVRCELLTANGTSQCELTAGMAQLRGDDDKLIVAITPPAPRPGRGKASPGAGAKPPREHQHEPVVTAMTRRIDLLTSVTRLLLENASHNEAITLQRCAQLLARELAAWVIADVVRGDRLERQFVAGPEDQPSSDVARQVAASEAAPGSIPRTVHDTGSSQLIAHAEDAGLLGNGPDGVPLLMMLAATSVLSVPLTDGEEKYGVLTLARPARQGHFEMADLGLVEELGEQLALAINVDRMVQRHTGIADALRRCLLPPHLPELPGVEIAATHLPATQSAEIGGDFYDVYQAGADCAVCIGDVCGRGEGVAATGAAARYAIRVIAHSKPDPATILAGANDIMLAEDFGNRFVTAATAHMRWEEDSLRVTFGCAGHPGPVLVRPDGRAEQLRGGGLPLGIFPDAELATEKYELSTGDVLVFFTDGLTDARDPAAGHFGDRLTAELATLAGQPPAQILARLQELALQSCGGSTHDDITMLALRVTGPPAEASGGPARVSR